MNLPIFFDDNGARIRPWDPVLVNGDTIMLARPDETGAPCISHDEPIETIELIEEAEEPKLGQQSMYLR